jgi:4-hydroxy-3-polyprenylbenzoate decarboxylase
MDLRDYMQKLDKLGELITIDSEVDWKLEAGCIAAMSNRVMDGKGAIWCRNIKGYPKGFSEAWSLWVSPRRQPWRRMAIAMDLDPDIDYAGFSDELLRRWQSPIRPIQVSAETAPCKENIMIGKDVDLLKLPFPLVHGTDGGRYQTFMTQIVQDPDTGWTNWGQYRFQILTRNKMVGLQMMGQHGPTIYYVKYEARGKDMPFAYAIGGDPLIFVASTMSLPAGICEADYAGGMRRAALEVVRCETNDLLVPASAEIIIEGVEKPHERADEGPFGEYVGFVHGRIRSPVYRVTCITHRNNPILPGVCEGMMVTDTACVGSSTGGPAFMEEIRIHHPDWPIKRIANLLIPAWSICAVSTDVPYPGYLQDLSYFFFSHKATILMNTFVFVDPDVDVSDAEQVWRAVSLNANPARDFIVSDTDVITGPVESYITFEEKRGYRGGAQRIIDATTPRHWDAADRAQKVGKSDLFEKTYLGKLEERFKSYLSPQK